MEQFEDLLRRHRQTTFIGAHVGCYAEDLAWVGRVLDACPNFYVDIGARIAELGRQPYTARDFYAQLFGYNYEDAGRDGPPYAVFTVPGGDAPGGGIGGTDPGAGNAVAVWSVCFRSDDVGTAVQCARDAGGSVLEEPFDFQYGRLAVVGGPDRESFAIMTPADPAQRSGRSRPAVRGGS
jgi:predicted enzyme related to lactoylglutathione lyase